MTKEELFATLRAAGVTEVTVRYDGYGDSGAIEEVIVLPESKPLLAPVQAGTIQDWDPNLKTYVDRPVFASTVEDLAENFVYDGLERRAPGWEINSGSYGEVVIDVTAGTIQWGHNTRFESSDYEEFEV